MFYKSAYFYAKQSQSFDKLRTGFWKSYKDVKLIMTRDYEKYIYCKGHLVRRRCISENKPKQSQFQTKRLCCSAECLQKNAAFCAQFGKMDTW